MVYPIEHISQALQTMQSRFDSDELMRSSSDTQTWPSSGSRSLNYQLSATGLYSGTYNPKDPQAYEVQLSKC